jgi:hypothetical protein
MGRAGGFNGILSGPTPTDLPAIRFRVDSPFPNPFNPAVHIAFSLPNAAVVEAVVYDSRGRRVKTLTRELLSAGDHMLRWNGADDRGRSVGSAVYLLEISAGQQTLTRKLIKVE